MCFLYAKQIITFKIIDFQKTWDRFREANPAFGTSVMLPRPQGFDTIHPEFGWLSVDEKLLPMLCLWIQYLENLWQGLKLVPAEANAWPEKKCECEYSFLNLHYLIKHM